ncbi:MAG: response regulator transcription factor [Spirochaetaceae bacterium]|nr:response regulator transcription factor [Spirochaetaceae bacterium]
MPVLLARQEQWIYDENMQGKILIIEDTRELADVISLYLGKDGFETRIAASAEDALVVLGAWEPEMLILDINLPGMDGFEFLQQFRKTKDTPVIIVSARDSDEDLVAGLGIGADEFVTKPFSSKVLVARVRSLFRRVRNLEEKTAGNLFKFGPFTLDMDACILKREDAGAVRRIPLSAKEFGCLACLIENAGKTLNPETIFKSVWKHNYGDLTAIAVYVQHLRRKIEDDPGNPVYIETIHGMGYRFNAEGGKSA